MSIDIRSVRKVDDAAIWSTGDEISFIRDMQPKGISKLEFLQNYKEGLCTRVNWDTISKVKVMKFIETEINKEKGI